MEHRFSKLELSRPVLVTAIVLVVLAVTLIVRGGGYGIGGLSWSNNLTVTRSSLRLGGTTVLPGDRIRYVYLDGQREVHRDADLRGALRMVDADEVFIELSRPHWEIAVPLTPEAIAQGDIPAALRGPFQVVAVDGRRITGVLDLAGMAQWMNMNGGQPAIFTVSVPEEPIVGLVQRVKRPGPILPVIIIILTLGALILAHLRTRSEVMSRMRHHWNLMGLALATGGGLLAFLAWHDGFLADPLLIPFGLAFLVLWRPLSLVHHQERWWDVLGQAARFARLGAAIPPLVLLFASFYGWVRTLPGLWGSRLDGFVLDQLRELILLGVVMTALYHVADIGLSGSRLKRLSREETLRQAGSWIGTLVATLFLVTASVALSSDPSQFLAGGWVPHLAGLVVVQWLGDVAALPIRWEPPAVSRAAGPRPDLDTYLSEAKQRLELAEPQFAVRFPGVSIILAAAPPPEPGQEGTPRAPLPLVPQPIDERVTGLLELLDAEGGMFPRHKTIRGADEVGEDPFEGLERVVGIELALPLEPSPRNEAFPGMKVHLISRRPPQIGQGVAAPGQEALEAWQREFFANPDVWPELRAAAAEGALSLMCQSATATETPAAGGGEANATGLESGSVRLGPPGGPSRPAMGFGSPMPAAGNQSPRSGAAVGPPVPGVANGSPRHGPQSGPPRVDVPGIRNSDPPGYSQESYLCLLHDRDAILARDYPVDHPGMVSPDLRKELERWAFQRNTLTIVGAFGSGREFAARTIHRLSGATGPCLALDCTGIPEALIMAELAGEGDCPGRLALAGKGTLIIRSLSLLSPEVAAKALKAAQGVTTRLVLVELGDRDGPAVGLPGNLGKRVGTSRLFMPPLAERPEDVERAARFYLHRWAMTLSRVTTGFTDRALAWLKQKDWPSNYHSLIACICDAVARSTGQILDEADLVDAASATVTVDSEMPPSEDTTLSTSGGDIEARLEEMERTAMLQALEKASGNKSEAARLLKMKRTTFIRKLAKYEPDL